MDNLFLLLMLLSFGSLIFALINPLAFQWIFKNNANRKNLSLYFSGATILFFILFGVTTPPIQQTQKHNISNTSTPKDENILTWAKILSTSISPINNETTNIKNAEQTNPLSVTVKSEIQTEKDLVILKLKEIAKKDWPNDYTTQEYWINKEIEDYEYMLKVESNSIKKQAQKDWPFDFSTQKYRYNSQIEAKERLK